ncbi:hypothetical protein O6H91_18G041200 [Diphasiastrum complanatum]|uniref:Uncharacterized protein n=2 Tax=Diphasiastrum complanatum TaxID=34168 RepID=A0ACC2B177_DIPCM|nr:hypothetical protein O6H91_18G041200 [Diphasiastrum complanatum]
MEYAIWLGMELPKENGLLWVAREGLQEPLPEHWKPCRTEEDEIYYYNFFTGESIWDHPCDDLYRHLYKQESRKFEQQQKKQQGLGSHPLQLLDTDQHHKHQQEMDLARTWRSQAYELCHWIASLCGRAGRKLMSYVIKMLLNAGDVKKRDLGGSLPPTPPLAKFGRDAQKEIPPHQRESNAMIGADWPTKIPINVVSQSPTLHETVIVTKNLPLLSSPRTQGEVPLTSSRTTFSNGVIFSNERGPVSTSPRAKSGRFSNGVQMGQSSGHVPISHTPYHEHIGDTNQENVKRSHFGGQLQILQDLEEHTSTPLLVPQDSRNDPQDAISKWKATTSEPPSPRLLGAGNGDDKPQFQQARQHLEDQFFHQIQDEERKEMLQRRSEMKERVKAKIMEEERVVLQQERLEMVERTGGELMQEEEHNILDTVHSDMVEKFEEQIEKEDGLLLEKRRKEAVEEIELQIEADKQVLQERDSRRILKEVDVEMMTSRSKEKIDALEKTLHELEREAVLTRARETVETETKELQSKLEEKLNWELAKLEMILLQEKRKEMMDNVHKIVEDEEKFELKKARAILHEKLKADPMGNSCLNDQKFGYLQQLEHEKTIRPAIERPDQHRELCGQCFEKKEFGAQDKMQQSVSEHVLHSVLKELKLINAKLCIINDMCHTVQGWMVHSEKSRQMVLNTKLEPEELSLQVKIRQEVLKLVRPDCLNTSNFMKG